MNAELNAFLALVEDRPEDFRRIVQESGYNLRTTAGTVVSRIRTSLDKTVKEHINKQIRVALRQILELEPPGHLNRELQDAYYDGVCAVEDILERILQEP